MCDPNDFELYDFIFSSFLSFIIDVVPTIMEVIKGVLQPIKFKNATN